MRRREFITLLGGSAAWTSAGNAQSPGPPVIGWISGSSPGSARPTVAGFRQGLRQLGYVEGQNAHIAFRWAEGRYDRFAEVAAELANLPASVIAAFGAPAALAALAVTKTIPIVFTSSLDPVRLGLVASLKRPGGNATGVAFLESELVGKQFELLHEMLPKTTVMGLLVKSASPNAETQMAAVPFVTQALGLQIIVEQVDHDSDLETAFAKFVQRQVGALVVGSDAYFYGRRDQLVMLAARHGLAVICYDREFVVDGGLM